MKLTKVAARDIRIVADVLEEEMDRRRGSLPASSDYMREIPKAQRALQRLADRLASAQARARSRRFK